ncbi:Calx-beta domain-containing protein [Actinoplanes sp. G11-F43]|uniref:Calx-beta domain-containing protein n=1 Tax=Actinoplanes sp. G11-F43 TaxID=3424130 RepID=UPI003D345296
MVPSAAWAAPIDFLTISNAETWEGGKLVFTVTYTGTTAANFDFGLVDGTATLADGDFSALTDANSPSFVASSTPPQISFPISSPSAPAKATVTVSIPDAGLTDAATETLKLQAVPTGDTIPAAASTDPQANGTGTIWNLDTANDIILTAPVETEVETATGGVQRKVTVTAKQKNPQQHDVTIPVKTLDAVLDLDNNGTPDSPVSYLTNWATSEGNANRDYTALPTDAKIVIPANETSGSISIELWDDTSHETATQYFRVEKDASRTTLGGAVVPGQGAVQIGIKDDDPEPKISVGDAATVKEGAPLTFPLMLTNPSEKPVTASLNALGVATGTAKAATVGATNVDPNDVVWGIGVTGTDTVTVPSYAKGSNVMMPTTLFPTNLFEGPENVRVTLSSPTNAALGTPTTANGIVTDVQAGQTVEYSTVDPFAAGTKTWTEGNSGPVEKKIWLRFAAGSTLPTTLNYKFADGTAKNGEDFIGSAGSISVPANSDLVSIPVTIIGDRIDEPDEKFKLVVTDPNAVASVASTGEVEFTITDDDPAPSWSTADVSLLEGNTGATMAMVPINLSGPVGTDAVFTAVIADGGAVEAAGTVGGNDYDLPSVLSVTVKAGESKGVLSVPINGDVIYERDEAFTVTFTPPATIIDNSGPDTIRASRVVIENDDAQPKLTYAAAAGPEGTSVTVVPTVVGKSQYAYDIGFAVTPGKVDPATSGVDFEVPATLINNASIPAGYEGALSKLTPTPFNLPAFPLLNDLIDEPTETFMVTATEASSILRGFAISSTEVRITDDPLDLPPAASIDDITVNEKDGFAEVPVSLAFIGEATSTVQTVTIPFWTEDGTAKAGQDYDKVAGKLEIPPGSLKWSIKVPIIDDWDAEGDENFKVKLGTPGPLGALVIKGGATVTIKSDDKAVKPTLTAKGPAKGAGKVSFEGMATPNSTVQLWGAALPTTDVKKFKVLASTEADAKGWFKFTDRSVTTGMAFAVSSQGEVSAVKTVKLTQSPSLSLSSTKGKLTASVTGNPKVGGQTVTVYWLSGKTWKKIDSGKTASNGVYKDTWTQKSKAKLKIRASVVNSTAGINLGWTAEKWITIK